MPNTDLLPSPLFKINENQLALEVAILEISNWVEQRGSADVADNVRGALDTIDKNEEFIKLTLAVLMTPGERGQTYLIRSTQPQNQKASTGFLAA